MKSAILIATILAISLVFVTITAKKRANISAFVGVTSILEPSISADSFNSRFLKRENDSLTLYPEIENFYAMDIVYE